MPSSWAWGKVLHDNLLRGDDVGHALFDLPELSSLYSMGYWKTLVS